MSRSIQPPSRSTSWWRAREADQGGPSVPSGQCPTGIFWLLGLMSADAKHTSPTPIPPAVGEFDLLRETAGHRLLADLCQAGDGRRLSGRRRYLLQLHPLLWPISLRCSRYARATFSSISVPDVAAPAFGWPARPGPASSGSTSHRRESPSHCAPPAFRTPNACPVRVASFDATGLPDASADGVVSVDALPFAPNCDAALRELRRVLRPGLAPCSRPAKPGSRIRPPGPSGTSEWPDRGLASASSSIMTSRVQTFPDFGCGSTVSGSS